MTAATPSRSNRWFGLATAIGVAAAVAFNLYVANRLSVVLPLADGWAVWDRLFRFEAGEMRWAEYLFRPHGAHLHSVIYFIAWFDYLWSGGDQALMRFCSLTAIAVFASAAAWSMWKWGAINRNPRWVRLVVCIATAALLTSVIDSDTLIQPFQAVLSISRLVYFALLIALVASLAYRRAVLYTGVMLLSLVAVTFHGSGYLFAGLIVVVHIIWARRAAILLAALLPLMTVFVVQRAFADSSGELGQLGKTFAPGMVLTILKCASAYFAMPLRILQTLGDETLLFLGYVLLAATAGMTLLAFVQLLKRTDSFAAFKRGRSPVAPADPIKAVFITIALLTGLFLLLSGGAAAVFWMIRTAVPGNQLPAYAEVFFAPRYTAYATLALVMLMGYFMTLKKPVFHIGGFILAVVLIVVAIYPAARIDERYWSDDPLNRAAAALSVGISPRHPDAKAIWPQASADPYWDGRLPLIVERLRIDQKSVWRTLPPLGASIDGPLTPLPRALTRTNAIDGASGRCAIVAALPGMRSQTPSSTLVALVSETRQVVGYATRARQQQGAPERRIDGYLLCDAGRDPAQPLFMSETPTQWHLAPAPMQIPISAENITDQDWLNGVGRHWAGFVVKQSPRATETFVPGAVLRLPDGQLKLVTKVDAADQHLRVFVGGGLVDGNVNGYPYAIERTN